MRSFALFALLFPFYLLGQQKSYVQKYKDSISKEIILITSDSLRASKYYKEANYTMRRLNDLKLGRSYLDSAFFLAKKAKREDLEAQCHFTYGVLERFEGNYHKALGHLNSHMRYFKNDSTLMSYALFQIGVIHDEMGDYKKSLKTYLEILKIFETKKDSFAIASTLNSIAVVNGQMGNNTEAIDNFKSAALIFEKLDQQRDLSNTLKNIGEMYLIENDTVQARAYLERALKVANQLNEIHLKSLVVHTLGKTYLNDEPQTAFGYLSEAEEILKDTNFKNLKISVYRDLGHYYKSQKNNIVAIQYYKKALKIADETNDLSGQRDLNKSLSDIYMQLSSFDKAYNYQNAYIKLKDSLINEEKIKSINQLQVQFETEKKEKEIIAQELKLREQGQAYQKKQTQYNYMTVIAIFFLLSALLTWFIYQQRQKRKDQEILTLKREHQIKTLETLIEGEEKERLRIAKELHDGVNGDLSAIKFKLVSLQEMNNKVIDEAVEMIDKSCQQVRAISHNLIPPTLESFSLVEATEMFCQNMNSIHQPKIEFQFIGDDIDLTKKAEVNIFRIIQELVANSIKHAEATEINVQISHRGDGIFISVEDNGRGFDVKNVKQEGIGLKNIRSRVEFLNAELDIISNKEGSSFTVEIDTTQID